MAASFTVIATDLRRVSAKALNGGFMIDVLEDACSKFKLDSEKYQLKHNNKTINLTDPVRASGLSQGAKLELVVKSKSPSAVTVALRLPQSEARLGIPNNRVAAKVRNDTPVWKLLRHLEEEPAAKQKGLNITARGVPRTSTPNTGGSGQLYWEAPVLKYTGRELVTLDDFRKTLSRTGIDTGSQFVHLEFRTTDYTLEEAMESVHRQLEREDAEASAAAPVSASALTVAPEAEELATPETTTQLGHPETLRQHDQPEKPELSELPEQTAPVTEQQIAEPQLPVAEPEPMAVDPSPSLLLPVQVWSPPKAGAGMPAAAGLRWARENYSSGGGGSSSSHGLAPSVAQMKAHQRHLEEAGRNKRLKSDSELEEETREREARASAVDKVDIRIRFPDGYTALWSFPNGATGATLHAAVRRVLTEDVAQEPFRLAPPMSREEIQDNAGIKHDLIRGYGMRGGVVINFLRGSGEPNATTPAAANRQGVQYVKSEVMAMAQDIVVPQLGEDDDDEDEEKTRQAEATAAAAEAAAHRRDKQGDATKKFSKFLRLAKK
ncbi:ubx domain protein [Grosmannia clavigera kw1407]|uniref:Ubx domain protein n=1 Tax=Grosmannia clavigera (strain kw1407 / UAMH 11150) TaxID=655863 RepID=F0XHC8_GROCL|nr:ubx domain protein [Grosmannia clavigera kw1407]EFX02782.1 ubx domain protein [Grosmannia clavigera kw1407]